MDQKLTEILKKNKESLENYFSSNLGLHEQIAKTEEDLKASKEALHCVIEEHQILILKIEQNESLKKVYTTSLIKFKGMNVDIKS
jgi:regulator of replication initiation timing